MNRSLVPVFIRPHLVKYLFEKFPGEEAVYCGKKVKSIRINTNSSIGKYIRMMCTKCDYPEKHSNYNLFFSVQDVEFEGSLYGFQSGKFSFLKFPEEFIEDLNELFEDMFRISFFYYVEGFRSTGKYGSIDQGIKSFIEHYELYEHNFNFATLQQQYFRLRKENRQLSPLISKPK